jgi:hypothetical protein
MADMDPDLVPLLAFWLNPGGGLYMNTSMNPSTFQVINKSEKMLTWPHSLEI